MKKFLLYIVKEICFVFQKNKAIMASLKTLNTGDIKILTKTVVNFKSQSQIYIYIQRIYK